MRKNETVNTAISPEEPAPATYSPVIEYIGPRIQELCEKKHMSRYRLAQRSGVPSISITRYINGQKSPAITTLEKLCAGFDISLSEFFEDTGFQPNPAFTAGQNHMLEVMDRLSEEDQKALLAYADYLVSRKN
ncbi:MAG: helix-turn-helix domain-containing protein [Lachnospiraceae bacterium]|nr:helix-turn-helix domain-containing protein [Lachnospiraceae bacterium]